ncbi:MAG: hypothetical protein J0H83_14770 [Candidatus Melainabacteria bacterium]|jgi:hypothetical protein|nr:hypothetical protein [Candidatus Melainabacteria bacterium]MBX9674527.1 hypothetical protein [Candidatus Obscuribacterales bacterium]
MSQDNAAKLLAKLRATIKNTVTVLLSKKADAQDKSRHNAGPDLDFAVDAAQDKARLDSLKQSIQQKRHPLRPATNRSTSLRDRQNSVLDQSRDRMRRTNRMQALGSMADQDEIGGHHGGH